MPNVESRTVRFHEYGEPLAVLREEQALIPEPPADRVRVRVAAVGLNPADWELCRGFLPGTLPRGVGLDVAGTVDAIGPGVAGVVPGDLVFGVPDFIGQPSAGVADVAILNHWFRVPEGLSLVDAAVLTMPVQTASWTLSAMSVGPGTTLLVHGAGSTVGYAAVQIALRMGATVVATAGPTFAGDLAGFGAAVTPYGDGMIDRVRELAGGAPDLVLDAAPPAAGALEVLVDIAGDAGRVVTISNHAEAPGLGARSNLRLIGDRTPLEDLLPEYAALAVAGRFRMPIARTYPFEQWRDAVEQSLTGRARGKLVLLTEGEVSAPA